jgi:phospholipid N-methyltransferase
MIFLRSVLRLLVTGNVVPSSPILVTLMMEAIHFSETWYLQDPHGVISQKTAFFIVTAMKTSNFTYH